MRYQPWLGGLATHHQQFTSSRISVTWRCLEQDSFLTESSAAGKSGRPKEKIFPALVSPYGDETLRRA